MLLEFGCLIRPTTQRLTSYDQYVIAVHSGRTCNWTISDRVAVLVTGQSLARVIDAVFNSSFGVKVLICIIVESLSLCLSYSSK